MTHEALLELLAESLATSRVEVDQVDVDKTRDLFNQSRAEIGRRRRFPVAALGIAAVIALVLAVGAGSVLGTSGKQIGQIEGPAAPTLADSRAVVEVRATLNRLRTAVDSGDVDQADETAADLRTQLNSLSPREYSRVESEADAALSDADEMSSGQSKDRGKPKGGPSQSSSGGSSGGGSSGNGSGGGSGEGGSGGGHKGEGGKSGGGESGGGHN